MKFSHFFVACALATTLCDLPGYAASYTVTSLADDGSAGTLRYVINQINQAQSTQVANVSLQTGLGVCTLTSNLPPLLYPASFDGSLFFIDGSNGGGQPYYRGLIVYPGPGLSNINVSLSNLVFANCIAKGGSGGSTLSGSVGCGGGGGGGLGGGLFIGPNVNATLTNNCFNGCFAQGGLGGTCAAVQAHSAGGGGGGFAGDGGGVNNLSTVAPVGAGGGGGLLFPGGDGNGTNWGAGGGGSGGPGQDGSSGVTQTGFGGTSTPFGNAGNGGNATGIIATSGATFGGGGGDVGVSIGGYGGFGAGGGGGGANVTGAAGGGGGFGGGGGGAGGGNALLPTVGGAGGYGGGGGGGVGSLGGAGGFGAASGYPSGAGGGGAGLGGGLFIHQSAVCDFVLGSASAFLLTFGNNNATVSDPNAQALGPDIFMMSGATLNLINQQGTTYTMPSGIASDYPINNALNGGVTVSGSNTIVFSGTNSFTGGIEVLSATLSLGATATLANLNPLVVEGGACFDTSMSTLTSIQVGEILSSGASDGLINIGSTNLGVNLFNSSGSFKGNFASSINGGLTLNATAVGSATTAFNYSGSSPNFLGTVTINPQVTLFLTQGGYFNQASTLNLSGGNVDASLLTSNQTLGAVIGTGTLNLGNTPLTVSPSYSCNFTGVVSGSNTLNVLGSSTSYWSLSGSSSFSGTVNLPLSQTMRLNNVQMPALFNLSQLSTLNVAGSNSINNLGGSGNLIIGPNSSLSFNTSGSSSFYGQFNGQVSSTVTVNGSGSLALYGNNQGFLGSFVIDGGSLILEDLGQLPQNIIINKPGTLDISHVGPLDIGNNVDLSNISGSGNVNIGAQNLVFINSSAPTAPFTGGISGSGNITFSGVNPFLLGGNLNTTGNIYIDPVGVTLSGSASISPCNALVFMGGTLTAGSITNINLYNVTGTGSVVGGNAGLTFVNTAASNFSGTLTSQGSLTFSGSQTFTLDTLGSITGSCSITSGTLNLLDGLILGSASNLSVLSGGVLSTFQTYATISNFNGGGLLYHSSMPVDIINQTQQSLSGTFQGSGTVSFQTGATTTILGSFYSNSPMNSLAPMTLVPNGIMTFDNSINVLNNLSVNGTGVAVFNGSSSATTVNDQQGSIIANGSFSCGNFNLLSQGLLGGIGTVSINGTFYPEGVIAPGFNAQGLFGTLTLNTSLGVEFTPSSSFEVSFGQTGQDALVVNGTCQIDPGATLLVNQQSFAITPYEQYTIMQTSSGVSGVFTNVRANIPLSQLNVIYNPYSIELALQGKLLAKGNAEKVAEVLNQNMMSTDPEVVTLLTNLLLAQSQGNGQDALDQLQLSPFKSASVISDNLLTNMMLGVVKECELDAITEDLCSCYVPKKIVQKKYSLFDDTSLFDQAPVKEPECRDEYKGHIYVKGLGSSYFQDTEKLNTGYKTLDGGLLFGGRFVFPKAYSLNAAVAYQAGRINFYKGRGHSGLTQVSFMLLGHYSAKHVEGAFGYGFGYTKVQDVRKINFINTKATAYSTHNSFSQAVFLKGGLLYNLSAKTTVGPYDYLSYIYQNEQGFNEDGANVIDLTCLKSINHYLRNELGVKFNHCTNFDTVSLKTFFKGAYVQEIRAHASDYTQKFLALPQSFMTSGYMPTRALGLLGFGLNVGFDEGKSDFGVIYDVEGCHNYIGQRFELGFSFHF